MLDLRQNIFQSGKSIPVLMLYCGWQTGAVHTGVKENVIFCFMWYVTSNTISPPNVVT